MTPGVIYTTFHFPECGANLVTTEHSDWATNCPESKVTAVQVVKLEDPDAWRERRRAERDSKLSRTDDAASVPAFADAKAAETTSVTP